MIHGNYSSYYGYRRKGWEKPPKVTKGEDAVTLVNPQIDGRLCILGEKISFSDKNILDIGCNDGTVTLELGEHFGCKYVLGIDIDESLIRRAKTNLQKRFSQINPINFGRRPTVKNDENTLNALNENTLNENMYYFPKCFGYSYGQIPFVRHGPMNQSLKGISLPPFPYNVSFQTVDIVSCSALEIIKNGDPLLDVILCFSVTKWIHMNGGDEALLCLFGKFRDLLAPNGFLVLEPQPWNSYYGKSRLDPKLAHNYRNNCNIKPDEFIDILQKSDFGFKLVDKITPASGTNMKKGFAARDILIFQKKSQ